MYCDYCATPLVPARDGFIISETFRTDDEVSDPERQRFWLGGARHVLLGRIGRGDSADVFLARRDHRITEYGLAKVLRAHGDQDLLDHEWDVLSALQQSRAQGSAHFTRLMPQPIARGAGRFGLRGHEGERFVALYRYQSGFAHSFIDVKDSYRKGIPAASSVWLWKRILEVLSFVHETGWIHGGILPQHLLVHARDHGVRLCGWSGAVPLGEPVAAQVAAAGDHYPKSILQGAAAAVATDITMSARALIWALHGSAEDADLRRAPGDTPRPLAALLERCAADDGGGVTDAWAVRDELNQAAEEVFGSPKFVPFPLAGWSI